jgi:hypothetical protein
LHNNDISEIGALRGPTNLTILDLANNKIKNVDALEGMTKLEQLFINDNLVSDISGLRGVTLLKGLAAYNNYIKDLQPLSGLTNLTSLLISRNKVEDLSPLSGMKSLNQLWLSRNPGIIDYSPIRNLYSGLSDKDFDIDQAQSVAERLHSVVKKVIRPDMSDLEKERAVHDYIVAHTRYDQENYARNSIPKEDYTSYGILVNGTGVCEGYTETFQMFMDYLDIECRIVTGQVKNPYGSLENHAWNIVRIGDRYYHVDVTWDDPVPDSGNRVKYDYFNLTDEQIGKDHIWDKAAYPECSITNKE